MSKPYVVPAVIVIVIFLSWWFTKNNPGTSSSNSSSLNQNDSTKAVSLVEISLQKGKDFLLYILLHSDGTNNRSGGVNEILTGPNPGAQKVVYMGPSERPMLKNMLDALTKELAELGGEHNLGGKGDQLDLTITIRIADRGVRIIYKYGSDTSGPPTVVKEFVTKAIRETDGWIADIQKKQK